MAVKVKQSAKSGVIGLGGGGSNGKKPDVLGDVGNFFGNAGDTLAKIFVPGYASAKKTGNPGFRAAPPAPPKKSAFSTSGFSKLAQSLPSGQEGQAPFQPQSLQDLLQQYLGMIQGNAPAGSAGVDYNALRQNAQQRAASSEAQLGQMYSQLKQGYLNDIPTVQGQFDTAAKSTGAGADQASAAIQQGYDSARDAQTKQLQALGIGDAAGNLAANGGYAAGDQSAAEANIAQNKAANLQQLNTDKATATQYQNGLAGSAGLEGATQQGAIQQQLNDLLAQYDTQEQQQNAQNAASAQSSYSDALSTALGLAKADNSDQWQQYTYPDTLQMDYDKINAPAANASAESAQKQATLKQLLKQYGITNPSVDDLTALSKVVGNLS